MKIIIGIIGLLMLGFWGIESTLKNKIIGRIKLKLKPPLEVKPYSKRGEYRFSAESDTVSVEMALNSRCTSDNTGNQKYHHWGMFDKTKRLTDEQTTRIVDLAKIPRFTVKKIGIVAKHNMLTFVIENIPTGLQRDWLMVESGMQQQAVGLVCAALGVGMVFRNLGKDGRLIKNNNEYGTVRIEIDPMQPSYDGSFWSSGSPSGRKPWLKGKLSDPVRNGEMPLIPALADLKIENKGKTKANKTAISQLLWAARGRTTHSIAKLGRVDQHVTNELLRIFPQKEKFIFIGRNDDYARAAWEIGYQLQNLTIQASSLSTGYRAVLLDHDEKKLINSIGVENAIAAMVI